MAFESLMVECHIHHGVFAANPETVVCIYVRENGMPLDMHDDETPGREFTEAERKAATQLFICPDCMRDFINPERRRNGNDEIPVDDSTYRIIR